MDSVGLQKCDPIFLKKWINAKPALQVTILLKRDYKQACITFFNKIVSLH